MDYGFFNIDCMEGMSKFPDKYFDLAIVDPVYGDVTKGGYMTHNKGQHIGTGKANQKGYHAGLWNQDKTGSDYFSELMRVSKNQIIWGGITLLIICPFLNVGLSGIKNTQRESHLRIASWLGHHLIVLQGFSILCGMGCSKAT